MKTISFTLQYHHRICKWQISSEQEEWLKDGPFPRCGPYESHLGWKRQHVIIALCFSSALWTVVEIGLFARVCRRWPLKAISDQCQDHEQLLAQTVKVLKLVSRWLLTGKRHTYNRSLNALVVKNRVHGGWEWGISSPYPTLLGYHRCPRYIAVQHIKFRARLSLISEVLPMINDARVVRHSSSSALGLSR